METIKLNYKDYLVCDPCYIKEVRSGERTRFDALRCIEVLHDGDDVETRVEWRGQEAWLGVDSGRIWAMQAEFDCEIDIDSGLSGHLVVRGGVQ